MFLFFFGFAFVVFLILITLQLAYELAVMVAPFLIAIVLIALVVWIVRLAIKKRS